MASRHLARSIVLQSLFEWDFYKKESDSKHESLTDEDKQQLFKILNEE